MSKMRKSGVARRIRKCSKCKKPNHNAASCGKPTKTVKFSGLRKCGKCGLTGHNARKCTTDISQVPEHHRIFLESKQKTTVELGGIAARKNMWIVSRERKKVAGKILQIKRNGMVLWENSLGAHIESEPTTFERSKYEFCDLEPQMLDWNTTNPYK